MGRITIAGKYNEIVMKKKINRWYLHNFYNRNINCRHYIAIILSDKHSRRATLLRLRSTFFITLSYIIQKQYLGWESSDMNFYSNKNSVIGNIVSPLGIEGKKYVNVHLILDGWKQLIFLFTLMVVLQGNCSYPLKSNVRKLINTN